jgi:hypothetical protein
MNNIWKFGLVIIPLLHHRFVSPLEHHESLDCIAEGPESNLVEAKTCLNENHSRGLYQEGNPCFHTILTV